MFGSKRERRKEPAQKLPAHLERRFVEGGASTKQIGASDRLRGYFSHHREVSVHSIRRMLQTPFPSLMTWVVIAIALALPAGLLVGLKNAQQLSLGWERSLQVSVYLKSNVGAGAAQQMSERLQKRDDIQAVRYISPDQALNEFKALSGFGEALVYLNTNPLPALIEITPAATREGVTPYARLLKDLQAMPEVDKVQMDMQWVERLLSLLEFGKRLIWVLGSMLGLAVLLVIGNTIRLAIEARRAEILVVKLVGGTNAFVRRPFLYTGSWYGLGGGLLAWLLIHLVLLWLQGPVKSIVAAYGSQFEILGLGLADSLMLILSGTFLGWLGAWIAVSRHLSEIEPR